MTVSTEKINKKRAESLLVSNRDNRKSSSRHVKFLAKEMASGNWKYTGDPIKFSVSGRLLDGQHRLLTVIESETEHEFLVIRGLPDNVFPVLDTGKNRSSSDALGINGFSDSNTVAVVCKMMIGYSVKKNFNNQGAKNSVSNSVVVDFAEKNRGILSELISSAEPLYKKSKIISKSEIAFYYYIFSKQNEQDAKDFIRKLTIGTNLQDKEPVLYLRNKFIEIKSAKLKMTPRTRMLYIIKAWNMTRKGIKIVHHFRVNESEEIPEAI